MPNGLSLDLQQEYKTIFEDIVKRLEAQPWFADGWQAALSGLDGFVGCQLFRAEWLVQPNRPVHFEVFIGEQQLEQQTIPIALHAHPPFPHYEQFAEQFIEQAASRLGQLPGYKLANKAHFLLLSKTVPFTPETLPAILLQEFERLTSVGLIVSQSLAAE